MGITFNINDVFNTYHVNINGEGKLIKYINTNNCFHLVNENRSKTTNRSLYDQLNDN